MVDDDPGLRKLLAIRLQQEGYDVKAAESGRRALAIVPRFRPHTVITDMRMSGMDGLALFEAIRSREPTIRVIVLTAHGTIPSAVDATQRGVFAYLTKPCDKTQLLETVKDAMDAFGEESDSGAEDDAWRDGIVTRSAAMKSLLNHARLVARSNASVLILGESGTGKELLARAIHRASDRKASGFVAVNCAAMPEQLFEAEMFGYEKGAFTGAVRAHGGLIQAANGGTLFLDEIGDMPSSFQAKLLRMLQEKEVRPVGATEAVRVDVRVISATHQDLPAAIADKTFREDLYYRLNVVALEIPSLTRRREDIPLLVHHFLEQLRARGASAPDVRGFTPEAMEALIVAAWPGNVRQLRNVVEQCAVLATKSSIPVGLVERALKSKHNDFQTFAEARDSFECDYLKGLLASTQGNVAEAARLAQRNRSQFYKLLHKHELVPESFRHGGIGD